MEAGYGVLRLSVNGQNKDITVDGDTPLLWVLRGAWSLMRTGFTLGNVL